MLMKNMLTIQPSLLSLFPFKDEPDVYQSPSFIMHSKKLVSAINMGIESCEDMTELSKGFKKLGLKHALSGVKKENYNVIGRAFLLTLEMCLKENFT